MRVLVIGGTGFIGSHVIARLLADSHALAVFHRGQTMNRLTPAVHSIQGERGNLLSFAGDFRKFAPDVVLDMIAWTEQDALTLMRAMRGIAPRVVAVSSMDVYAAYGRFRQSESGEPDDAPLSEESQLRRSLYPYRALARNEGDFLYHYDKIPVERVVMNEAGGTILRLSMVYGEADRQHRTREYVRRMRDGRPAILLGEKKYRWRCTRGYAENVAAAIALAVVSERAAGRIYNVGEVRALTEAEWVGHTGEAAGWQGEIIALPEELLPGHLVEDYDYRHNLAADTGRIRAELGFVDPVSHPAALARTVAWETGQLQNISDKEKFDYAAEDAALAQTG